MFVDENKHRIETLKRMLAVGKSLIKSEISEVYELGHYIADNVLSKVCMLIGLKENRKELVYTNKSENHTKTFPKLYRGILEHFYDVPKYTIVEKFHRDRSVYQHGIEHLDVKTIKKPLAIEYISFVEKIMKIVGYLGKDDVINPISIISSNMYNAGDRQRNILEEKFRKLYNRLVSDDLEHIYSDISVFLDDIGRKNLKEILKMDYRKRTGSYGDSMLIEYQKWDLRLNDAYRPSLSISKHNEGNFNFGEPDKNPEVLQEFLGVIRDRCKDFGLNIS